MDGEQTEHHYWNRIDGEDLDLTRQQFTHGEIIEELDVVPNAFLRENMHTMKPDMLRRIELMSERVAVILGERPPRP